MINLNKIEVNTVGDREHNRIIDTLFADTDQRTKYYKQVRKVLESLDNNGHDWIFYKIQLNDSKKINAIIKSKTQETFKKRVQKYVNWLEYGRSAYSAMFEKDLIHSFKSLIN